jgi:hypothetical protein
MLSLFRKLALVVDLLLHLHHQSFLLLHLAQSIVVVLLEAEWRGQDGSNSQLIVDFLALSYESITLLNFS